MKKEVDIIKNVTIGADPEMFLFSESLNKYVPVCGLIGGTKEEPLPITDKGHFVQEDNVMVEYCIPPCSSRAEFLHHIQFVKNYIDETLLKPKGLISKCIASANFSPEDLESEQAQRFGCESDYDVYTFDANRVSRANPLMRTAGGHIHVGYDKNNPETSFKIIKAMDLFLGLPSIILDPDTERRTMYGKAGCYRIKTKYGLEYRTLSTFWTETPELIAWAYNSTQKAIDFVNMGGIITNEDEIVKAINTCDVTKVFEILDEYNIYVEELSKIKQAF